MGPGATAPGPFHILETIYREDLISHVRPKARLDDLGRQLELTEVRMPVTYGMRSPIIGFTLTVVVTLVASASRADETIDATDPHRVLVVIQNFHEAALGTDNLGDPKIEGRIEGKEYLLSAYDCSRGRQCKSLTFSANWAGDGFTDAMMADWNREKRFGKAYLDQDGRATVEMSVNLDGGVSRANLESTIDWWRLVLVKFTNNFDF